MPIKLHLEDELCLLLPAHPVKAGMGPSVHGASPLAISKAHWR